MSSRLTVATPWPINFAEIFSNCGKKVKQEVTKFGSRSLRGFRVAANTMVVWYNPPPQVGNRVKHEKDIQDNGTERSPKGTQKSPFLL